MSWTPLAGAASYRIYRSSGDCEDQWFEIGETSGTQWTDDGADEPRSYAYRVEAVDADGFCVSAESNCATATPASHHATSVGAGLLDVCASGGAGSGDGVVDPGEAVLFPVTLHNDGGLPLSDLSGTLSVSTPGVTVIDSNADWPAIAPGEQAVSLPNHFGWQLSPFLLCGTPLDMSFALSYDEGANDTELSVPVGVESETILVDEDFSGGIPPDWIVVDGGNGGGSASTWTDGNPGGRSIGPPFDAPFAIVDSDDAGPGATQDEQLISPRFDATGCSSLTLEFSNQFRWFSTRTTTSSRCGRQRGRGSDLVHQTASRGRQRRLPDTGDALRGHQPRGGPVAGRRAGPFPLPPGAARVVVGRRQRSGPLHRRAVHSLRGAGRRPGRAGGRGAAHGDGANRGTSCSSGPHPQGDATRRATPSTRAT